MLTIEQDDQGYTSKSPSVLFLWGRTTKHTNQSIPMKLIRSTTILAIRHKGEVVIAGDGQVSLGQTVIKHNARKVRRLYHDKVITGFAGSTADAYPV